MDDLPPPRSDTTPPHTRAQFVDRMLRQAIVTGDLGPGERLHVTSLGERWSVSPTPLREAFQRLAVEGLLELTPQRGARVSRVTVEDAHEVHEIRMALEPLALRSSMEAADGEWHSHVQTSFDRLARELRRSDPNRGDVEDAHRGFHLALLANCTSAWLSRIIDLLMTHVIRYWTLSRAPRRNVEDVIAEHDRLLGLCSAGRIDAAVAELTVHLQNALDNVAERIVVPGESDD